EQAGLAEKTRTLLKRNPQRLAFQVALTRTYATFSEQHPQWTGALFDQHFLAHAAAPLLARCLLRSDPPTGAELAATWADHLALSEETRTRRLPEATRVAGDFLATLDRELRNRSELQPLFDSRALDTTAVATTQTAQSTAEIAEEMRLLREELNRLLQQLMAERPADQQNIRNDAPNQGAQGIFNSPVYVGNPPTTTPPARSGTNPFIAGNAVPPERFYGRAAQREHIKNRLGGSVAECVSIVGMRRSGKSSLLRYIRQRIHEFCAPDHLIIVTLDLQDRRFHTPEGITEGLRRGIEQAIGSAPWQRDENSDPWAITDGLEQLRDRGQHLLVLIDEFEQIGRRLDQFQDWGDDWRAKASAGLLALVIATLRPLEEIYTHCGLTSPFGNIFTRTTLGALEPAAWQTLVQDGFAAAGNHLGAGDLPFIHDLAGGLPYYTQLAAAQLWQHGDHARVRVEFTRQATPRFAELWRDLRDDEQRILRHAAGVPGVSVPAGSAALHERLHDDGLLRADGQIFSRAFADFVREQ
ncbi:MAG: hypothetical protein ACLFVO_18420, partial [Chloroflexaceae bacterium]